MTIFLNESKISVQPEEQIQELIQNYDRTRDRVFLLVTQKDFDLIKGGGFTYSDIQSMSIAERSRYLDLLKEYNESERKIIEDIKGGSR